MDVLHFSRSGAVTMALVFSLLIRTTPLLSAPVASPVPVEAYAWKNVAIYGGGYVTGIIFNRTKPGLIYLRTDIGGVYRWEGATGSWRPLLDWVSRRDANLLGAESLATDPVEPNRVYVAAGTYTNPRTGNGEILRSIDFGDTWQRTPMPFKMGGNESGRGNGERLAVDPNENRILYFGTRRDGLWRSADFGATWSRVESFPAVTDADDNTPRPPMPGRFNFPVQSIGVVAVEFDPASGPRGQPTPTLYVAISSSGPSLFRSVDSGVTWAALTGQPMGFRPNHLVLDGNGVLYVSYGKEPGPNTMTDGALWKFDPKAAVWAEITPVKPGAVGEKFGYGGVAVDARQPGTLIASTFFQRNEIYRSTDAGRTWSPLLAQAEWDHSTAPYTRTFHPHWMSGIAIDPFNSDHVLFTTGYGIWATANASVVERGQTPRWTFDDRGVEETVPLGIISPPDGAHLLSGLGDIDGFRHDDLDGSPPQGTFTDPHFTNTESIDFAARAPSVIVRSGTLRGPPTGAVRAAYSVDGGKTWRTFVTEPPLAPTMAKMPYMGGAGSIAISADARTVVWTPRGGSPNVTRDWGATWTTCSGAVPALRVIADSVNPAKFYGFDTQGGVVYVSLDAGLSFSVTARDLPKVEGSFFPVPGDLHAAPGIEGDLWLAVADALYHSTDSGATFTRLGTIEEAATLGFGKAAPGRTYPAIFLAGKVQGMSGVFRSDDVGANWERLTDDRHQFAAIIHLTGDPRIFGRIYLAVHGRGIVYGDRADH
jgi:photosystem II stability/assembly factor-like uncharacterized protein